MNNLKILISTLFFICLSPCLFSDVRSLNGTIPFDINSDTSYEMILNSTGLGIGGVPSANLHVLGHSILSGRLDVGGQGGSSNLNIFGSLGLSIDNVSTNTTLGNTSILFANTASNNIFLTLPAANLVAGRIFKIKKTSLQNQLWLTASENIEGYDGRIEAPAVTSPDELPYMELISNGSSWYLFNKSSAVKNVIGGDNLVARWLLDETTGTSASDSSSFAHHGTLNGGSFSFSTNTTSGKIGRALNFNGSSDYIEVPYSSDLNLSKFTCSLWARVLGGANSFRSPLTSRDISPVRGFMFYASDANVWEFWTGNTAIFTHSAGPSVVIGAWTFLVGIHDGANQIFYVNGQQVDSDVISLSLNTAKPLRIGAGGTEGGVQFRFNGDIDDVRIYNRVLTSAEIQAIYLQSN